MENKDKSKKIDELIESRSSIYREEYQYPDIQHQEEQACFYKMSQMALRYASTFFDCLCGSNDFKDKLPIVFRDIDKKIFEAIQLGKGGYSGGHLETTWLFPKFAVIYIYLPRRRKNTFLHRSLKQTIRHEVIHYYLWLNGLPYEDDTALFWAYCWVYDAGAYKKLSPEQQSLYDAFLASDNESARYRDRIWQAEKLIVPEYYAEHHPEDV